MRMEKRKTNKIPQTLAIHHSLFVDFIVLSVIFFYIFQICYQSQRTIESSVSLALEGASTHLGTCRSSSFFIYFLLFSCGSLPWNSLMACNVCGNKNKPNKIKHFPLYCMVCCSLSRAGTKIGVDSRDPATTYEKLLERWRKKHADCVLGALHISISSFFPHHFNSWIDTQSYPSMALLKFLTHELHTPPFHPFHSH